MVDLFLLNYNTNMKYGANSTPDRLLHQIIIQQSDLSRLLFPRTGFEQQCSINLGRYSVYQILRKVQVRVK